MEARSALPRRSVYSLETVESEKSRIGIRASGKKRAVSSEHQSRCMRVQHRVISGFRRMPEKRRSFPAMDFLTAPNYNSYTLLSPNPDASTCWLSLYLPSPSWDSRLRSRSLSRLGLACGHCG